MSQWVLNQLYNITDARFHAADVTKPHRRAHEFRLPPCTGRLCPTRTVGIAHNPRTHTRTHTEHVLRLFSDKRTAALEIEGAVQTPLPAHHGSVRFRLSPPTTPTTAGSCCSCSMCLFASVQRCVQHRACDAPGSIPRGMRSSTRRGRRCWLAFIIASWLWSGRRNHCNVVRTRSNSSARNCSRGNNTAGASCGCRGVGFRGARSLRGRRRYSRAHGGLIT